MKIHKKIKSRLMIVAIFLLSATHMYADLQQDLIKITGKVLMELENLLSESQFV